MSNRTNKEQAIKLLEKRDKAGLLKWAGSVRNPQRILISLAYSDNELIKWRSIEAIGIVSALMAKSDLERVRDLVRRLFWLMNDESGGLGWSSPEMIGEILVNIPELIDEFGHILIAYFDEEPFERGSHLAVSRVASINPEPYKSKIPRLIESLNSSDTYIQYYALLILHSIEAEPPVAAVKRMLGDSSSITIYDFEEGTFSDMTVDNAVRNLVKGNKLAGLLN